MHRNFNEACYTCLMYPSERPLLNNFLQQQQQQDQSSPSPCQIFGAEHLLRMVVHMPNQFQALNLNVKEQNIIISRLNELMAFLNANYTRFFEQ